MTFKRHIGRLPIIPTDAKEHNVTCQFCIVGCGYKAYTWDINQQGGPAPSQNKFGVDLSKQQDAMTTNWYAPAMYNIVKQDGKDVNLVIKPDHDCVVNSGLGSIRGARMAEESFSEARSTQQQRLTEPMVWRYGQMQPTSWDDALDLVARVTAAVIDAQGEDGLYVSAFDHGGAGGGYENTWGTGKLYFGAMKIKNIRIHNRPAYNSEVHATRDMGVGELNNCYEDAELADTIVAVGTNALETQTNYFLNHWVPNLRGVSMDKKNAQLPGEAHPPARIIFVDPRRTVTVNACEFEAGKDRVLHLSINSGTDLALFNAWLTYIAEKGWVDRDFIAASTKDFDKAVAANKTSLEDAAKITGLSVDDIRKSAEWIAQAEGRRRASTDNVRLREGPDLGQRQLPHQWRPGERRARHRQHRTPRRRLRAHGRTPGGLRAPGLSGRTAGSLCRPAPDRRGKGGVHHIWACDHYKTTLNADKFKQAYKKRTDLVKDAMSAVPYGDQKAMVAAIVAAIGRGRAICRRCGHCADQDRPSLPRLVAGRDSGRDKSHLDEWRTPLAADRALYGPARPVHARLPHRGAARQQPRDACFAKWASTDVADKFKGFDWKTEEDAFMDGYHANAKGGEFVTYERLRAMGTNGVQEPATGFENGKLVGTKRLFADGKFGTKDGKATFMATQWRGLQAPGKEEESKKFAFLINNGRANHVWQSAYLDQQEDFVMDRWPYPLHPDEPGRHEGGSVFRRATSSKSTTTTARRRRWRIRRRPPDASRRSCCSPIPIGVQGNVVSPGVNELIIPNYKQTWGRHSQDRLRARRRAGHRASSPGSTRSERTAWIRIGSGDALPEPLLRDRQEADRSDDDPRNRRGHFLRAACGVAAPLRSDFQTSMRTSMADQLSIGMREFTLVRPVWTGDHLRSRVGDRSLRFSLRLLHGGRDDVPAKARTPDARGAGSALLGVHRDGDTQDYGLPAESRSSAATSWGCSVRCRGISKRERFKRSR